MLASEAREGDGRNTAVAPLSLVDEVSLKSVLAATDFSPTSEKSVRHALAIARDYGAKPHVLHVARSYGSVPAAVLKQAQQLERELRVRRGQLDIREGDVWTELQNVIQQRRIDLVVVGTHGHKGLKKLLLGSIAEQVFRHASCPVLTVGPYSLSNLEIRPSTTPRPILLATDFCEGCAKALTYAVSLANRRGARLALLHVVSPAPVAERNRWYTAEDVDRERNATRAAMLQRLQDLVFDHALAQHPMCMAEFGSPADRILSAAEKLQAETIIMGLQRKAFDGSHLCWSTAYEVVCTARCPVLTIRSGADVRDLSPRAHLGIARL